MSNPALVVVASLLSASLAGGAVFLVTDPERRAAPPGAADAALQQRLDDLATRLDGIERRVAVAPAAVPVERQDADAVTRAAVERWIADALAARADGAGNAESARPDFAVDAAVADLAALGIDADGEAQAIWARAREAGKVDELIEAFERRAQEMPNSADAHADLGAAYVQGIVSAKDMLQQSVYGQKADAAYDAALALDDTHWRARFSKAMGLTYWPDFLGKKQEAIRHFEILATQQEGSAAQPEFVHTWRALGNLYAQQGKDDEARAAWERGLRQFPDDPELRARLKDR